MKEETRTKQMDERKKKHNLQELKFKNF